MTRPSALFRIIAGVIIVTAMLVAAAVNPSSATPTSGVGLVRVDAGKATADPIGAGSYLLTLPGTSTASWLGERVARSGARRLRVESFPIHTLHTRWTELGLAQQDSARATLTWNSGSATPGVAVVHLARARSAAGGRVAFRLTSDVDLPRRMRDVTLNVDRADGARMRSFPAVIEYSLAEGVTLDTTLTDANRAVESFVSDGTACYTASALIPTAPLWMATVNIPCGSLTVEVGSKLQALFPTGSYPGQITTQLVVTASGKQFAFFTVAAQWTVSGP